jgi:formylglycine-generating enzyme required for sulfatase activity
MSGKYALIIGNTDYIDSGLAQLSAPGKDAEDFARVLKDPNICAFDDVKVLLNEFSSSVIEKIDEFFDQRKTDDLLVLYFSGHGVRDEFGSLYLAFKNTVRARLRSTAIKDDYIRGAMDQSRSKRQVVILDCCNSGAFPQGTKAETGGVMGLTQAFKGYGRFVLTASDATQFAWEGDQVIGETDNSLFTHFLVKGLEGEADNDGDGKITVDELYDYAFEEISKITAKQTPTKSASKVEGEIVLRQNIRLEDTKPIPLPDDLVNAINSSLPFIREGAVSQLESLLKGKNLSLARSARLALERMVEEDDSRKVALAAKKALGDTTDSEKIDLTRTAQLRREKLEMSDRFKAEQEKLQREKAELEKRLQEEHLARERAEAEQKAKEAEIQRLAAQQVKEMQPISSTAQPVVPSRSGLSAWPSFAVWGIVIIALGAGGYAAFHFLPLTTTPTPTEPLVITQAAPNVPVIPTEAPVITETPTETATANPTITSIPTEITDGKGIMMVFVQAGDFPMGSSNGNADEKPIHSVYLSAYYIDKFEVTNELYRVCVNAGSCNPPVKSGSSTQSSYYGNSQFNDYPVVYVTWTMAKNYCEWRGAKLPTEAQWEKAARGSDGRTYPWGKGAADCQRANYHGNTNGCVGGTSPAGNYENGKSPYGAYDMAGNVWEWVADWYSAIYYQTSLTSNPPGPDTGQSRVIRGGSWTRDNFSIRSTTRVNYAPSYNNFDIGFRCAGLVP